MCTSVWPYLPEITRPSVRLCSTMLMLRAALQTFTYLSRRHRSQSLKDPPRPAGWADVYLGTPLLPSPASYANGVFTVAGSSALGVGHFAFKSLHGDGTIVARLASLVGLPFTSDARIMFRDTLLQNVGVWDVNSAY